MGKFWQQARYIVIDGSIVDASYDVLPQKSLQNGDGAPNLDWQSELARAIAEGALEEWVKAHPGVDLPDVI